MAKKTTTQAPVPAPTPVSDNTVKPELESQSGISDVQATESDKADEGEDKDNTEQNAPIKPILSDNTVKPELQPTSTKLQNKMGVMVDVSPMAAKILRGMDNSLKFEK